MVPLKTLTIETNIIDAPQPAIIGKVLLIYSNPVVTYAAEAWTSTKKEEQAVLIF